MENTWQTVRFEQRAHNQFSSFGVFLVISFFEVFTANITSFAWVPIRTLYKLCRTLAAFWIVHRKLVKGYAFRASPVLLVGTARNTAASTTTRQNHAKQPNTLQLPSFYQGTVKVCEEFYTRQPWFIFSFLVVLRGRSRTSFTPTKSTRSGNPESFCQCTWVASRCSQTFFASTKRTFLSVVFIPRIDEYRSKAVLLTRR